MAKAKVKQMVEEEVEIKKGLDIKLKVDKSEKGRITITVTLLQDGEEIASDYDFVQV